MSAVQVCRRASARIQRVPTPRPHRTAGDVRLDDLTSILGDEAAGFDTLRGPYRRLAARLNDLANYAHTAAEAIKQPSPEQVSSDYY